MSESVHGTKVRVKIFNIFWFILGIVAGCILNYLILLFNFSPENIVPLASMLCFACFLLIAIWPITIIVLLKSTKYKGNDEK